MEDKKKNALGEEELNKVTGGAYEDLMKPIIFGGNGNTCKCGQYFGAGAYNDYKIHTQTCAKYQEWLEQNQKDMEG